MIDDTARGGPTVRQLLLGFAAFGVLNIALLLLGSDLVVIRTIAVTGYALGVAGSLVAALRWPRPGARRLAMGLHLAMAPLQFLFSVPQPVPLLGIAFSIVILARCRPVFPRMAPRTRRIWLVLHVGMSVGWLGLSLAMTTLAAVGLVAGSPALRHGAYEVMHIFDLAIVIPSMVLAIVTGLVVSLGTKWGLVKHWWVLVKFGIALSIPLVAAVESQWVQELGERTADPAAEPGGLGIALLVCLGGYTAALWTATVLSVVKPWGRTRWGGASQDRASQDRTSAAARTRRPATTKPAAVR